MEQKLHKMIRSRPGLNKSCCHATSGMLFEGQLVGLIAGEALAKGIQRLF